MENKMGIATLKVCLEFIIELGNVVDRMGRTKGAAKYGHLLMLMDEATALSTVDFKQFAPEFKDLDAAEKAELHALVKSKLNLADDKLEAVIVEGLALINEAASIYERGNALIKALKA